MPGNLAMGAVLETGAKIGTLLRMFSSAQAYPLDLVRTRLSAQTKTRYYQGIWHALRTIVKDEGVRGLYRCGPVNAPF